jgi:hypothetical protein
MSDIKGKKLFNLFIKYGIVEVRSEKMHPIKIRRIMKLSEQIQNVDPFLSQELYSLAIGASNKTRPTKLARNTLNSLTTVKEILDKGTYAIIGGVAIHHWISSRTTDDIDIAVTGKSLNEIRKEYELEEGHLVYTVDVDGTVIDFMKSNYFPWTDEAIRKAKDSDLGLPICTPEYLILYKFKAGREKDFSDIKGLLKLKGVYELAKPLIKKYFAADDMQDFEQLKLEADYGL